MIEALLILAALGVNVVVGVLIVRDVTAQGRSPWWLLWVKLVPGLALPAYLLTRAGRRRGPVERRRS